MTVHGYICRSCGGTFDEPRLHREDYSTRADGRCPFCGSQDITEATLCDDCEKLIPAEPGLNYQLCPECREAVRDRFEYLLSRAFRRLEIDYLNDYYDGELFGVNKK